MDECLPWFSQQAALQFAVTLKERTEQRNLFGHLLGCIVENEHRPDFLAYCIDQARMALREASLPADLDVGRAR